MKRTIKILGLIAITAILTFSIAACKPAAPSGTYRLEALPSWTITFDQSTFTMSTPAEISPSGFNTTNTGAFILSGKTVTLTGLDQPMVLTIKNASTLTESDGSVWKK